MSVIEKTIALLGSLTPADVRALPPARRRLFADVCRHFASVAEPRAESTDSAVPRSGVLSELRAWGRYE
jgi:hypothetical protein